MFFFALRSEITDQELPFGARKTPDVAAGLENNRYPPAPRIVTELLLVELRLGPLPSDHTKEPVFPACAPVPAANANAPARLPTPPGIVAYGPAFVFKMPPPIVEFCPPFRMIFPAPPAMVALCASDWIILVMPPPMVEAKALFELK